MNCEQVEELLSAYLDDTLAAEEFHDVAMHVQTCSICRHTLTDFRHFDVLLAQLPRVTPDRSLRERIFSSAEYYALTGTLGVVGGTHGRTTPLTKVHTASSSRPHLVVLPGGRSNAQSAHEPVGKSHLAQRRRRTNRLRVMRVLIVILLLPTIAMSSFIGWRLWHEAGQSMLRGSTISLAKHSQGPIPDGIRFTFLRDGTLWSAPDNGSNGLRRLTPDTTSVATGWAVRPALPGHPAGNMLAYIDLQQGFVHTIRSDGQSDTTIPQPLLKHRVQPDAVWDTTTGATILSSLAWSNDGSMLTFVADPTGTGQTRLYIYTLDSQTVYSVPLPATGAAARPVWSPDSTRVAFEFTQGSELGILDYNTQNHGILTITSVVNAATTPTESILTLNWSPDNDFPAITWSVGNIGHVRGIWWQRVGVTSKAAPQVLAVGNYVQAVYNQQGYGRTGGWLLVTSRAGLPGDIQVVGETTLLHNLTSGKQVSFVQWSPDGTDIDYLEAVSSSLGTLHMLNITTGADTQIAMNVTSTPPPTWSPDNKQLAYSTATQILIAHAQASETSQTLKLSGPASALSWSVGSAHQLVLATGEGQQGIYLIDTQRNSVLQVDTESAQGPLLWTQIP